MAKKVNNKLALVVFSVIMGALLFVLAHQSLHQKSDEAKTEIPVAIVDVKDFIDHAMILGVDNPVEEGFRAARKAASELAAMGYIVMESQDVFEAHERYYVIINTD
jgi:hypothetical protein